MSTLVGHIITELEDKYTDVPAHAIAAAISLTAGGIITGIGLLRLGWIVDLISLTSLSAFMTGSAITIGVGQLPNLLGIQEVSNRESPYLIIINTWMHLRDAQLDAVVGISALTMLYAIRFSFVWATKRWPTHQRQLFFANTLRTVFVILLYTLISFMVNRTRTEDPAFGVLGEIPKGRKRLSYGSASNARLTSCLAGFQVVGVPPISSRLVRDVSKFLPATVIVLLVEHIAISKSFGRINNYVINPSQEMIAIGVTNILGPFVGGYPSTGSFSRTAIQSKAGVRTPASGIVTVGVVILASYLLTGIFFYIPSSALAAVIIHAVADLLTTPNTVYQFWKVSPIEVFIFFGGVIVSVFRTIEDGIYATVCLSAAMLLYRILKAQGSFLGKVKIHSVLGDHVIADDHRKVVGAYGTFMETDNTARNIFLPINHGDGSNPEIDVANPYPGIYIYRFSEGFNYPNASHTLDHFLQYIFANTRRTSPLDYEKPGDRPWSDPGPSKRQSKKAETRGLTQGEASLPTLKSVILDFSSVNNVDITSVQRLIDVRNQLDRFTAPDVVDWHIACINNRWTKRALTSAGFGLRPERDDGLQHRWKSIFSVAEIGGANSAAEQAEMATNEKRIRLHDEETGTLHGAKGTENARSVDIANLAGDHDYTPDHNHGHGHGHGHGYGHGHGHGYGHSHGHGHDTRTRQRRGLVVHGLNRPLFHVDLTSALQSAIANVEARMEMEEEPSKEEARSRGSTSSSATSL